MSLRHSSNEVKRSCHSQHEDPKLSLGVIHLWCSTILCPTLGLNLSAPTNHDNTSRDPWDIHYRHIKCGARHRCTSGWRHIHRQPVWGDQCWRGGEWCGVGRNLMISSRPYGRGDWVQQFIIHLPFLRYPDARHPALRKKVKSDVMVTPPDTCPLVACPSVCASLATINVKMYVSCRWDVAASPKQQLHWQDEEEAVFKCTIFLVGIVC
jgi:hypothetical protein